MSGMGIRNWWPYIRYDTNCCGSWSTEVAEKALRDSGIVSKQGFIGRTLTVGDTGDHDLFIRADARTLTEILVEQKKATVVTPHPADSYELITNADKVVYKLVITDPERFWSSSKVLVVSYRK